MNKISQRGVRLFSATLGTLLLSAFTAARVSAATITVTTTSMAERAGDGCGLMEAVKAVNTGAAFMDCNAGNGNSDIISLRTGLGTYTLTRGITFTRNVILASAVSATDAVLMVSSSDATAIASVGVNLELRDIHLEGNSATDQVGVSVDNGGSLKKLTLTRSRILSFGRLGVSVGNMSLDVVDSVIKLNLGFGGISLVATNNASLNVRSSIIAENKSVFGGGGVFFHAGGPSSIVNSTIAGNEAQESGGGMALDFPSGAGKFDIIGSTIAFNTAGGNGGGVAVSGFSPNVSVSETIVGSNAASVSPDWAGTIAACNNSMIQSLAGTTISSGTHNNNGVDPGFFLDRPQYLGGKFHTEIIPLRPTSAAIDWNTSSSQTEDQRHFPRGVVASNRPSSRFDVGAQEYDPRIQVELLNVVNKSSDPYVNVLASDLSNGAAGNLQSDAVSDFVTYEFPNAIDACVSVFVGVKRTSNGARLQVEANVIGNNVPGQPDVWSPIGPVLDLWASTNTIRELELAKSVKLIREGIRLRFRVVGRNSANRTTTRGFQMVLDYVRVADPTSNVCFTLCQTPPCSIFE